MTEGIDGAVNGRYVPSMTTWEDMGMTDKPNEAAIREACRRAKYSAEQAGDVLKSPAAYASTVLAASLIEKYEPETLIDPVTKRAREIFEMEVGEPPFSDHSPMMLAIIRALKEGMPK